MDLYLETSYKVSELLTRKYSTSFSLGIKLFPKKYQDAVYSVYGFVRLADEIVDTFHMHDKYRMLEEFRAETYKAIAEGISVNPLLHSFQNTVNQYHLKKDYIDAFLRSMEMDLTQTKHDQKSYDEYVYGSAEAVGLMCLQVFCHEDPALFAQLEIPARRLGSAFQKVNFLRDIQSDLEIRRRIYLPDVSEKEKVRTDNKKKLEAEIEAEFRQAYAGICRLPRPVRLGVHTAYRYYLKLFEKIQKLNIDMLLERRVRISNPHKIFLMIRSFLEVQAL